LGRRGGPENEREEQKLLSHEDLLNVFLWSYGHSQLRPQGQQMGGSQGMICPLQALAGEGVAKLAMVAAASANARRTSLFRMSFLLVVCLKRNGRFRFGSSA
jgi:hypothetical protein